METHGFVLGGCICIVGGAQLGSAVRGTGATARRRGQKRLFRTIYTLKCSFYQDRLGTNIRKTQKKTRFCRHGRRRARICEHSVSERFSNLCVQRCWMLSRYAQEKHKKSAARGHEREARPAQPAAGSRGAGAGQARPHRETDLRLSLVRSLARSLACHTRALRNGVARMCACVRVYM